MTKIWENMDTDEKLDVLFTDINRLFGLSNEEIRKHEKLETTISNLMGKLMDLHKRVTQLERKKMP